MERQQILGDIGEVHDASEAARALSALGASKGGKARAAKLTAEERATSAKKAAEARWAGDIPQATHGSPDHPIKIGDIEIPCYVLDDGRRVLVQAGMLKGMDMSQGTAGRGEGDRLARFIGTKALNPFVPENLSEVIKNPIKFRVPSGGIAYGYEATVLADLCDAVLDARKRGKLHYQQEHIAAQCEILVRGFARVGIVALVDEATGYQSDRASDALAEILEAYISRELSRWAKTFSDDYYRELFRLRGVKPSEFSVSRPQYIGHLTNDIVYKRLAPGVLQELQRITPRAASGRRKHKFFQRLTEEAGHPKLKEHLEVVVALMKISPDYKTFRAYLDKAKPPYKAMPLLEGLRE